MPRDTSARAVCCTDCTPSGHDSDLSAQVESLRPHWPDHRPREQLLRALAIAYRELDKCEAIAGGRQGWQIPCPVTDSRAVIWSRETRLRLEGAKGVGE